MIRNQFRLHAISDIIVPSDTLACDIYTFALTTYLAKTLARGLLDDLLSCEPWVEGDTTQVAFCVHADDKNPSPPVWVSVSERVPPGGSALVYVQGHGPSPAVGVAHYSTLYGWATGSMGYDLSKFITHWMPLPSPPQ